MILFFLSFVRVLLHLLWGLFICAVIFPLLSAARRTQWVQNWSKTMLRVLRVELDLRFIGETSSEHALVVANHISWMDVFVINAVDSCCFVAKAEISDWPVLGWLCKKAGAIFIKRGKPNETRRVQEELISALINARRVAFFPEGTTAAQGQLLPFHSSLFESAIVAGVPVKPYALRYLDEAGNWHPAVDFVGETTFFASLMAVLKARGMKVQLLGLPPIVSAGLERTVLAQRAHEAVCSALSAQGIR